MLVSISIDKTHLLSTATFLNFFSGFIFYLLIIRLQRHKILNFFKKSFGYFRIIGYFWTLITVSEYYTHYLNIILILLF